MPIWVFNFRTRPRYGVWHLFLITIIILLNTSWCGLLDEASTHWTIKPIPRLTIIITVWKPGAILWIWHISWTYWERLARHRAGLINPPEDHLRLIETLWLVHMNRQCTFCDMRQDIELYGLASLNSARVVFLFCKQVHCLNLWFCYQFHSPWILYFISHMFCTFIPSPKRCIRCVLDSYQRFI